MLVACTTHICAVNVIAASFLKIGLKPGDRIGIWAPNNSEWAGLILTNINPAYRTSELKYALNKACCTLVHL
jgi:fatty-acyl-CoA synthase